MMLFPRSGCNSLSEKVSKPIDLVTLIALHHIHPITRVRVIHKGERSKCGLANAADTAIRAGRVATLAQKGH